jgi:hypothetical protein
MRRATAAGLLATLMVIASGCGGSSSNGPSTSQQRSLAAFTKCLNQHGVKGFGAPGQGQGFNGGTPPPTGGTQGGQPPSSGGFPGISTKLRKAIAACRSLAPRRQAGTPPGFQNGG